MTLFNLMSDIYIMDIPLLLVLNCKSDIIIDRMLYNYMT